MPKTKRPAKVTAPVAVDSEPLHRSTVFPGPSDKLLEFYNDKPMMIALADFLAAQLKEVALERVFRKQDTTALPDAQEVIERAFAALKNRYDKEPKRLVENRGV